MKVICGGPHSVVISGGSESSVIKVPLRFSSHELVPREVFWVNSLPGDRFPYLKRASTHWLEMSHCGDPLTSANLPPDWREQGEEILRLLKEANCSHNDIRPDNFTVKDGRLYLLDFAWATEIGEPIPPDWPKALGGRYRKGEHDFDDAYSLWKSLEEISGS